MIRRAQFQFGATLPKGPRGQVDAGLGKVDLARHRHADPAHPSPITEPFETHRLDGVEIVFQLTPETEAPAEMHMFYPALRALNLAENATHNLHNTYPIRGAQVRDANAWAKYIDEALARFAPGADVVFAQHHWPVWGRARLERLPPQAARPLQVPPRPDRAPHEPRLPGGRDRRAARAAPEPRAHLARARLLRHAEPQREGGVPALSRLVRRQSRQPQSPAAGGAGAEVRRVHGRRRGRAGAGAGGFRARRVPVRGGGDEPPRLRRSRRTPRRAPSAPTRWSSSAIRRSRRPGATPICSARSSSGRAGPARPPAPR